MSDRPESFPWRWCLAIFATALLIRGLYLLEMRNSALFAVLMVDGLSYDTWARRIIAGEWYGREVFYQAPMYPYFLAVVYWLFSPGLWPVRLVQAVVGSGSCVLLGAGSARFFDRRVGVATGFLAATAFLATGLLATGFLAATAFLATGFLAATHLLTTGFLVGAAFLATGVFAVAV